MYLEDNDFRLVVGDLRLALLNQFFEVPDRNETVDWEIEFEINASLM